MRLSCRSATSPTWKNPGPSTSPTATRSAPFGICWTLRARKQTRTPMTPSASAAAQPKRSPASTASRPNRWTAIATFTTSLHDITGLPPEDSYSQSQLDIYRMSLICTNMARAVYCIPFLHTKMGQVFRNDGFFEAWGRRGDALLQGQSGGPHMQAPSACGDGVEEQEQVFAARGAEFVQALLTFP